MAAHWGRPIPKGTTVRAASFAIPQMTARPDIRLVRLMGGALLLLLILLAPAARADIERFVGEYTGSADVASRDGTVSKRDMSVEISETRRGFSVKWSSTTYKADGRAKEKAYMIDFVPSDRDDVYAAAMKRNVFGHEVQLDPMKGEPYVWGRIVGDTMTVFSMFVDADGGYEIQQFDRTLATGGLMLDFKTVADGESKRSVTTFLKKS